MILIWLSLSLSLSAPFFLFFPSSTKLNLKTQSCQWSHVWQGSKHNLYELEGKHWILLLRLLLWNKEQNWADRLSNANELKRAETLTEPQLIHPIQCDNDSSYNISLRGALAFVAFPFLHYRKLQKEENCPNLQHNHSAVIFCKLWKSVMCCMVLQSRCMSLADRQKKKEGGCGSMSLLSKMKYHMKSL